MEKNLGHATAYGYAKSKGYTGTEEEFGVLMASYASVAQDASQSASSAAESAQLASSEAQKVSQSATSAHNDAETASNIKTDVESARDTTVSAKNAAVEAKDISVEAKNSAISAKDTAENKAQIAEAWAVGQKDGTDVPSTDETYHNNAKYYSEQANTAKTDAESAQQLAQTSATNASESASEAAASTQTASQAAQTATDKASEASQSASTATTKASEASQSASTASSAATSASTSAQTATTAAATATTKASEASESATTASTAKTDAESARDAAAQSASEAAASAESIDPETLEHRAYGAYVVESATDAIASFPDGADDIPMKDVFVHIEPVQEGSGDPSPDNVRPISGWTGTKVTRCGKNLLDTVAVDRTYHGVTYAHMENGGISVIGTATDGISYSADFGKKTLKAGTYKLSAIGLSSGVRVAIVDETNKIALASATTIASFASFTLTGDTLIHCYIAVNKDTVVNTTTYVQIESGSTATAHEPYSGQTYDITFPTEAGTVYGGTLDVTSGVLTVDRAIIASYAGEILPSTWISDRDVYSAGVTPTTGAQVCYYLASPITYQLTPQEITSLLGENNVWADTGNSDVEYRADVKLYITKKITEAVSALS